MLPHEPFATAVLLTGVGILLALAAAFSRASRVLGLPVVLLFLAVGMLAGSDGLGRIHFEDYELAFRLGTVALALILFDGGLNTPLALARLAGAPSVALATIGVAITALLVGLAAHLLGLPWPHALLLGAIVSSTDAAAVFSVLRGSNLALPRRLGATLEMESGLNDPLAVVLTLAFTGSLLEGHAPGLGLLGGALLQLLIGLAAGCGIGFAGRWILPKLRLPAGGLYAVFSLALAFLAFGVPTLLAGSGFLAVYVAGIVLGNGPLPYRSSVLRVNDAAAWLAQILMFLTFGLLVYPSRLPAVAGMGIAVALVLAFVARPVAVFLCLAPFRFPAREQLYLSWAGLRGAVPIILAIYPVLAGVPGAERIFDVVFFVVVVSIVLQGGTLRSVTRWLGLEEPVRPAPPAVLEIASHQPLQGEVLSFTITPELAVAGLALSEIPFPAGAAPMLLLRGDALLPPAGSTVLENGDHLYLLCRPEDEAFIHLLFGQTERP